MWDDLRIRNGSLNGFSVDLEDWYQGVSSLSPKVELWSGYERRVYSNTQHLLSLLATYGVKATFFVLGCVAKDHPDLVRMIDAAGHEVGVHGYWHRKITSLTPDQYSRELDMALEVIRPLTTRPIIGHRAPYFSINKYSLWALDVLAQKGFLYDSSFFPVKNMLYGYPGSPRIPHHPGNGALMEFPMSTLRIGFMSFPFAGGFYMRIWPYAITRWCIRYVNRKGLPAIMYTHPWEMDVGHRYNHVTPREWIVQYVGRNHLEPKFKRLFTDFKFVPLGELLTHLEKKSDCFKPMN